MPHLSPMEWTLMLISSFTLLSTSSLMMFFMKNAILPVKPEHKTNNWPQWKWFQDYVNCKFTCG